MKTLILVCVAALLSFAAGCTSQHKTASPADIAACKSGDLEQDNVCLQRRAETAEQAIVVNATNAKQQAAQPPAAPLVVAPPMAQPAPAAPPQLLPVATSTAPAKWVPLAYEVEPVGGNPANGCLHGFNVEIENNTGFDLQVVARGLHVCGDGGGVIPLSITQKNGGVADGVPVVLPGQSGFYYLKPEEGGLGPVPITFVPYVNTQVHGGSLFRAMEAGKRYIVRNLSFPVSSDWGGRLIPVASSHVM